METYDIKSFRTVFEAVSKIVDEILIEVSDKGLKTKAIDPEHACLVDLYFKKDYFTEFEATGNNKIGIDLQRFIKYLKRFKGTTIIDFADENMLKISNDVKTFNMPLIDISEEELKVPSLDFPAMVKINSELLKEAVKDIKTVSDEIVFSIDGANLSISGTDEVYGSAEVLIPGSDAIKFKIKEPTTYKSKFNIEYLEKIIKAGDAAYTVEIYLGDNIPLKLKFATITENMRLIFMLAPRIDENAG